MEIRSESKIQNEFEREHSVSWRSTINVTNMETQIEILIKQKVTVTPRLLFFNYNQVVWWSYIIIVVHCCRYNTFPCLSFVNQFKSTVSHYIRTYLHSITAKIG
jgi:hypothetical protein